jgi:hypothetical protein
VRYLLVVSCLFALLASSVVAIPNSTAFAQSDDQLDLTFGELPAAEPKGGYFSLDGTCAEGWPVKAGITASGVRLYYLPDDPRYDDAVAALCFALEFGAQFEKFAHAAAD